MTGGVRLSIYDINVQVPVPSLNLNVGWAFIHLGDCPTTHAFLIDDVYDPWTFIHHGISFPKGCPKCVPQSMPGWLTECEHVVHNIIQILVIWQYDILE